MSLVHDSLSSMLNICKSHFWGVEMERNIIKRHLMRSTFNLFAIHQIHFLDKQAMHTYHEANEWINAI